MTGYNAARLYALVGGAVYVLIGIVGFFVTGFDNFVGNTDEALLGFALNPFHNVVHLGAGAALVAVALVNIPQATQGVLIGVGLVLLLAGVLGFFDTMQILSISSPMDPDNFLHVITGGLAVVLGFLPPGERAAS